jgi:hypothetical protein
MICLGFAYLIPTTKMMAAWDKLIQIHGRQVPPLRLLHGFLRLKGLLQIAVKGVNDQALINDLWQSEGLSGTNCAAYSLS